ncbi:hypothetical protein [Thiolapillus sp.]
MNNTSLKILFVALFSLQASALWANAEDDAYYAAMEQLAAEAGSTEPETLAIETRVDMEARMKELRGISPSAWATYKRLRPSYKAEVRKALKADKDLYQVIELIFARNT